MSGAWGPVGRAPDGSPGEADEMALLDLVTSSWKSQAVRVAAELRIPELLADGPRTGVDVAVDAGTDEGALVRFLRALTTLDLVREAPDGRFELRPLGRALPSVRSWAIWWAGPAWPEWERLVHSVRTGEAARPLVSEARGFEVLDHDAEAADVFHRAMSELTRLVARRIVAAYDFSPFRFVADIGGGYGELLAAILLAHPGMEAVLFDRAQALDGARRHLEETGVVDRCELVGGDFFDSVPAGPDLYVLKSVLHDWGDDDALRLLGSCRRAMAAGARLLLVERVVPDHLDTSPEHQAVMRSDLHMLVAHGAKERTETELAVLLTAAGFDLVHVSAAGMGLSLLEAAPSPGCDSR